MYDSNYIEVFLYARLKTGRIMLWRCPAVRAAVRGHFSFPDFFFAVFAATALKLGILLCSKELQFQFAFQHD
jgi:hypothetical protein